MAEKKAARPRKAAPTSAKKQAPKRDLIAAKLAFVAWRLDPMHQPSTQAAFAKEIGVDAATLSDWKRDPLVIEHMRKAEAEMADDWAVVLRAQYAIATSPLHPGSTQAATFLAKTFGKFKPDKVEHSGRMSLADFLAQGGFTE